MTNPEQATQRRIRTLIVSVVPSPYQRDLFAALAQRPEMDLQVDYLTAAVPDSPWPERPLAPYERVLPGIAVPHRHTVYHWNWGRSRVKDHDIVVMNTLMSFTAQWMMRTALRGRRWIFWGERLSRQSAIHDRLVAPLRRASAIAGIGKLAVDDYSRRFPAPLSFNIPYHCDLDPFLSLPRTPHSGTVFLCCAQMIARKGIDVLLDAFSQLRGDARLLLVGREANLPDFLTDVPPDVRNRIEYAGFHAPDALAPFFARADVFVLPSRYDGWGVVVNQAIAAGLPVICTDRVGAAHDILIPWVNGVRIPAEDPEALRAAMQQFLDIPWLCEAWGINARIEAKKWTPARGAERWVAALQKVLHH